MGFVGQFSQVLNLRRQWKMNDADFFDEESARGGVVITVAGVVEEHEKSLAGDDNVLFKVTGSPEGKSFLDLMSRMMSQRTEAFDKAERLYANTMGGEIQISPKLEVCRTRFQANSGRCETTERASLGYLQGKIRRHQLIRRDDPRGSILRV
jgi:hypothetical protein